MEKWREATAAEREMFEEKLKACMTKSCIDDCSMSEQNPKLVGACIQATDSGLVGISPDYSPWLAVGSSQLNGGPYSIEYNTKDEGSEIININKIDDEVSKIFEAAKAHEDEIRKSKFHGSILANEIIQLVSKNNYVTEAKIISMLRGLRTSGWGKETDGCGKFKYVPNDDIEEVVKDLVKRDAAYYYTVRGTYGRYDVVRRSENAYLFEWSEKEAENFMKGSDYEVLNRIKTTEPKRDLALSVLERKAVVCAYPEEVKKYCSADYCLEYAKAMYSMEDRGLGKSYWKMMTELLEKPQAG